MTPVATTLNAPTYEPKLSRQSSHPELHGASLAYEASASLSTLWEQIVAREKDRPKCFLALYPAELRRSVSLER